ncbi:MAG: PGF-pre-PGF domain-containing protein [Methanomicrobiaceae archaeon]|nr:PGF-pre-PGF domain-containing protein [Methanomicrobiaceae archaeon]
MHTRPAVPLFSVFLAVALLIAPASADTHALESSFVGSGTAGGEFTNPYGIAVSDSGFVYVADTYNHRIQVFSANGTFVTSWGSFGSGDDQFMFPYAVAVNGSGMVHVADNQNKQLKIFTPSGAHLATHPFPGNAKGIAVDEASRTLCTDWALDRTSVYNTTYALEGTIGSAGSGTGQFWNPTGIAVAAGEVFVADTNHHRIQVFSADGTFLRKWPSDIIAGTAEGDFNHPYDLAVNRSGFLFVTDRDNDRVQIFSQAGDCVEAFACTDPCGIATGAENRVYVTSASGACVHIYRIPPAPAVTGITPSSATSGSSCVTATVRGSDFQSNPAVSLQQGATTIPGDNATRLSAETITCTFNLSSADTGTWDVRVMNDDGKEGVLIDGFAVTHEPPQITAISPDEGVSGDVLAVVRITGSGFLPAPQAVFRRSGAPDLCAGDVVYINGTHITCSLDLEGALPGARDVIVRNTDSQEDTLAAGFTVIAPATPAPTTPATPEPTCEPAPAPRAPQSGEGGVSSTAAAYAADLVPGENRTLALRSGALQAVTIRVTTPVDSVLVTASECRIPAALDHLDATLYACTAVTFYRLGDEEVEAVWFTFALPASWLTGEGCSPAGVEMLRFHDGAWEELPAAFVGEREGMAWFRVKCPGCSCIAVVCMPDTPSRETSGEERQVASAPVPAPSPVPSRPPAPPEEPDSPVPPAQKSPLTAAPLLSLPLVLLRRRRP